MLTAVLVLDYGAGWGSSFTGCAVDFASFTAVRDSSYLYARCDDGEVVDLPNVPEREALSLDEIVVSDGADSIERQGCGLVSDRTQSGQRSIVVSCGHEVFRNGFGREE
jgi:hypothetical protein